MQTFKNNDVEYFNWLENTHNVYVYNFYGGTNEIINAVLAYSCSIKSLTSTVHFSSNMSMTSW